jgi:hypothetical protein
MAGRKFFYLMGNTLSESVKPMDICFPILAVDKADAEKKAEQLIKQVECSCAYSVKDYTTAMRLLRENGSR